MTSDESLVDTAPQMQVLIVAGQDKHLWRETSPYFKDFSNATGRFEVRKAFGISTQVENGRHRL